MNEKRLEFLMLIQTYAITKTLSNKRDPSVSLQVLANAMEINIESVPFEVVGGYLDAVMDYVNYDMQIWMPGQERIPAPDWVKYKSD